MQPKKPILQELQGKRLGLNTVVTLDVNPFSRNLSFETLFFTSKA